jgi:hypothetical protein
MIGVVIVGIVQNTVFVKLDRVFQVQVQI